MTCLLTETVSLFRPAMVALLGLDREQGVRTGPIVATVELLVCVCAHMCIVNHRMKSAIRPRVNADGFCNSLSLGLLGYPSLLCLPMLPQTQPHLPAVELKGCGTVF